MDKSNDAIKYLKDILANQGLTLDDSAYMLIAQTGLLETRDQAKAFAKILKDTLSGNYDKGYSDGYGQRAYEAGQNDAQLMNQIDELQAQVKELETKNGD